MPAVSLQIGDVPVIISARSPRLVALFADYFRYYDPQLVSSFSEPAPNEPAPLIIELKMRHRLPPRAPDPGAGGIVFTNRGGQPLACDAVAR